MTRIAIFRPGKHAPGVTAADAQRAAETYNPAVQEAPVVIGHPATNKPAWGWVKRLEFDKAKNTLFATLKDLDKRFVDAVRKRRFPKMSASFYRAGAPGNPAPAGISFRHLGFTGAAIPAVPGLPEVNFADDDTDDNALSFDFTVEAAAWDGGDGGDTVDLSEDIAFLKQRLSKLEGDKMNKDTTKPDEKTSTVDLAQKQADLAALEASLKKRQVALDQAEAARLRREHADFVEKIAAEGKILPRQKEGWVSLMSLLGPEQTFNFTSKDSKDGVASEGAALDFVKDALESLPPRIRYDEFAKAEGDAGGNVVSFKAPAGAQVEKSSLDFHQKIEAYAKKHNLSYDESLRQLGD